MYVFLETFFSVKNSREQATIHLLHFSISCDGLGNGMKTFFPDSSNSTSDFGQYSRYLESVLHSPWQQCFVLTILGHLRKHTLRFTKLFACFLYILALLRIHSLMADCNVCLSLAGGLMRQNLLLKFVHDAIKTICNAYNNFHNNNPPIPSHYLKKMLGVILKENLFQFKGENYLQTHGTAMGTKMA